MMTILFWVAAIAVVCWGCFIVLAVLGVDEPGPRPHGNGQHRSRSRP